MDIFEKAYLYDLADKAREAGIYPYFRVIQSDQDTKVIMNGQKVLMLGSNSYLGLTNHPYVKKKAIKAIEKYGTGCAGSRFLNGTLDIHLELEDRLAALVGKEASLVFATGYQANLGAISAIASGKNDIIVTDKLDHASILDGIKMSFGKMVRYNHADMNHLEKVLKLHKAHPKVIVTDGIFSMDGDIANLPAITFLAEKYGARVIVDDAHAVGVLSKDGGGTAKHFGLTEKADLVVGTFSKSLASVGGFVAGEKKVIDFIKHNARSLIFSASLPPGSAGSVMGALDIMEKEPERIERLWENTAFMLDGFKKLGFNTGHAETPIIPVIVGDDYQCFRMWKMLEEANIFVNPTVSPAVPKGQALIRTSFMATHKKDELEYALDKFEEAGKQLGII
jgi:8-amino-7-oxononanoate synthase